MATTDTTKTKPASGENPNRPATSSTVNTKSQLEDEKYYQVGLPSNWKETTSKPVSDEALTGKRYELAPGETLIATGEISGTGKAIVGTPGPDGFPEGTATGTASNTGTTKTTVRKSYADNIQHSNITSPDPAQAKTNQTNMLSAWQAATNQQAAQQIDYGTNQSVQQLQRAMQDAQNQFRTQQQQISADEAAAKDNAALYAEMRGDKGGIGAAQYNAIMNTAARNRQLVASEQTKLATDTARQIADLRAQGEFKKADALLQTKQQYLSQLMGLEQWAAQYGLSYDQLRESIVQWDAQYNMQMAQLLGQMADGQLTYQAQNDALNRNLSLGQALIQAGVIPNDEQLRALGLTPEQARNYILALGLKVKANNSSDETLTPTTKSGGGGSGMIGDWLANSAARNHNGDLAEAAKAYTGGDAAAAADLIARYYPK